MYQYRRDNAEACRQGFEFHSISPEIALIKLRDDIYIAANSPLSS
jgi:hypothetical protein